MENKVVLYPKLACIQLVSGKLICCNEEHSKTLYKEFVLEKDSPLISDFIHVVDAMGKDIMVNVFQIETIDFFNKGEEVEI